MNHLKILYIFKSKPTDGKTLKVIKGFTKKRFPSFITRGKSDRILNKIHESCHDENLFAYKIKEGKYKTTQWKMIL